MAAVNFRVPDEVKLEFDEAFGQFREDLYYRLNVVHIEMPSLGR